MHVQLSERSRNLKIIVAMSALLLLALTVSPELTSSHSASVDTFVRLDQNYPNPFNGTTVITYSIPGSGHVKLEVFNMLGKEMQGLVDEDEGEGEYRLRFDGNGLPSGQYTYRMIYETSGSISKLSRKMYLVK